MTFHAEIQVGYYDADDTYHGLFEHVTRIDAFSVADALAKAQDFLHAKMHELQECNLMARSCG